jgi:hypothetical protein
LSTKREGKDEPLDKGPPAGEQYEAQGLNTIVCPITVAYSAAATRSKDIAHRAGALGMQSDEIKMELSQQLADVHTAVQLDDWSAHFQLLSVNATALGARHNEIGLSNDAAPQQMRPLKVSRYQMAVESGIDKLAKQLAIATERFAESVATISKTNPLGIPISGTVGTLADPTEVARGFLHNEYTGTMLSMAADEGDQVKVLVDTAAYMLEQVSPLPS